MTEPMTDERLDFFKRGKIGFDSYVIELVAEIDRLRAERADFDARFQLLGDMDQEVIDGLRGQIAEMQESLRWAMSYVGIGVIGTENGQECRFCEGPAVRYKPDFVHRESCPWSKAAKKLGP